MLDGKLKIEMINLFENKFKRILSLTYFDDFGLRYAWFTLCVVQHYYLYEYT